MSAVLADPTEVLPPLSAVAAAVQGPGQAVIDADTGAITFEHKGASLLLAEATAVLEEARDLAPQIDSDIMYTEAGDLLKRITDSFKSLDEKRLETTKPLRDKVDEINSDYKPAITLRQQAADMLKGALLAYDRKKEQERLRLESEQRARAEEERRRIEAEARQREEQAQREAQAARDEAERTAAQARAQAEQDAAAMRAQADEFELAGNIARAEQLRGEARELLGEAEEVAQTALFEGEQTAQTATFSAAAESEALHAASAMVTPSTVSIPRARVAGLSKSTKYTVEVKDPKAFLGYVLTNWETMNHLVEIQQGKLDNLAQNQKERCSLPGCVVHKSDKLAARRR